MKTTRIALLVCFLLGLTVEGTAQFSTIRPSARLLHATRGGFFIGLNQSFHGGDIPSNPFYNMGRGDFASSPTFVSDESSTNFIFGAHIDKAVSRNVTLGLRVIYDQMSLNIEDQTMMPFRVRTDDGELAEVELQNNIDYCLRYITFAGVMKVYFYRTYGFYFLGGVSIGTLMTGDYEFSPTVSEPSVYEGSRGITQSDDIPEVESFRFSLIPGFGYDIYYRGVFITPEIAADIPLTDVIDDGFTSTDVWRVLNLRASLGISFIIL